MTSFKPRQVGKGREREKIKKIIPMGSHQTRNRKFQKNSKKFKKLENTIITSFQAKISWEKAKKEGKQKKSF